eukprot:tig00021612_g22898.t1
MAASLRSALPWPVARARFSAEPRVQVELRWILNSDLRYVFGGSSKMDGTSTWHFDVEHKSFPYVRGLVAPTPGFAVFFPVELDDVRAGLRIRFAFS